MKPVHDGDELVVLGESPKRVACGGPIVIWCHRNETNPRSATKPVATDIDQDSVEPGWKVRLTPKRSCRPPSPKQGIANGVLSLGCVAQDEPRQSKEPIQLELGKPHEARFRGRAQRDA